MYGTHRAIASGTSSSPRASAVHPSVNLLTCLQALTGCARHLDCYLFPHPHVRCLPHHRIVGFLEGDGVASRQNSQRTQGFQLGLELVEMSSVGRTSMPRPSPKALGQLLELLPRLSQPLPLILPVELLLQRLQAG